MAQSILSRRENNVCVSGKFTANKRDRVKIPQNLLLRYYRSKVSPVEIAEKFNCSRRVVASRLKKSGVSLNKKRDDVVAEEIAAKFFEDGYSIKELSRLFACSRTTIYNRLKEYDDKCDISRGTTPIIPKAYIVREYKECNRSINSLAKDLDLTRYQVRKTLEDFGVAIKASENRYKKFEIGKDELIYLYTRARLTIATIAKELGVTERTISNRLKSYGCKIRGNRITTPSEKFAEYYKECKSITETAHHFRCCYSTARKKINEAKAMATSKS